MKVSMFSSRNHDLIRFGDGSSVRSGWDSDIDPTGVSRKSALLLFVPEGHKPAQLNEKFEPIQGTAVNPAQILTLDSLLDLLWSKGRVVI